MKRFQLAVLPAFLSAALTVSGCGAVKREYLLFPEREEKTRLTVSVWDNSNSPQFQAIAEAFMKENPEILVELIDIGAPDYDSRLAVLLAGGESDPDVIMIKNAETQATMKEKKQLLCLDKYVEQAGAQDDIPDIADQLKMDGKQYTLPFRQDWYVLYYNKDLFDQAKIPYPSQDMTWMEYERLAYEMTDFSGKQAVYGSYHHTWMAFVSNWAVQDGSHDLMAEDYSFLKPYYEQAIRMQEEGSVPDYGGLKAGGVHYTSAFEQGRCAMMPMGTWFLATLIQDRRDNRFDFDWGVARIPHPMGEKAGSTVGSVTPIGINSKTDIPDLAWRFVKFAAGKEGAEVLADNHMFPALNDDKIVERLAAMEGFPPDGAPALVIENLVLDRPLCAGMAEVRKIIEEEHDKIMIGSEDIDIGIENMKKRTAKYKKQVMKR